MGKTEGEAAGRDADLTRLRRSSRRRTSGNNNLKRLGRNAVAVKHEGHGRVKREDGETQKGDFKIRQNGQTELYTKASRTESVPGRQYWLMKAEPESRLEKGHDIKFSIDDLAMKREPEPWDGIRSYPARNNLRAMRKGDLAFFYHSSCKVPAIVGVMEIVKEHSPDFTAQDSNAPYYDPKDSDPSDPKWSVVHVEFREKFKYPVTLKELKDIKGSGESLQDMQMLKQSRLSVTRCSDEDWRYLIGILEDRENSGDADAGTNET
ncbi:MAG: hypothetical protein M1818_003172 [Claussenomyces sp. TS43310]|nr:MAG: hypothetical protein M1818_003172 [Claussenomyces sp. TS43310]